MAYKPTGKPPGRPRTDGLPAGTKPLPKPVVALGPFRSPFDVRPPSRSPAQECIVCFPTLAGTDKWDTVSCDHMKENRNGLV